MQCYIARYYFRSDAATTKQLLQSVTVREHFVFTDADGLLYHFVVEGNMIKDGSKIPPDVRFPSLSEQYSHAEIDVCICTLYSGRNGKYHMHCMES